MELTICYEAMMTNPKLINFSSICIAPIKYRLSNIMQKHESSNHFKTFTVEYTAKFLETGPVIGIKVETGFSRISDRFLK